MWLALCLTLTATISVLSLLRGDVWIVRIVPAGLQKLLHVAFYAALAFAEVSALSAADISPRTSIATTAISVTALGATLEWLQSLRPDRFARMADVALDVAGAILGVAIWLAARS